MIQAMGIDEGATAVDPEFQRWKYWRPHPLEEGSRGRVLFDGGKLVAHGARWPIRLCGAMGELQVFHLIDWAAERGSGGAGMEVMRLCSEGAAAVLSIGGSAATRKIVPIFGFRPQNQIAFLEMPLHPFRPAWDESSRDWKMPARLARNFLYFLRSGRQLAPDWSVLAASPDEIPQELFPTPVAGEVVSVRNAALLKHVMSCPGIERWRCCFLRRGSMLKAYFLLAQVGSDVRMVDYGPSGLDETTGRAVGLAAREMAQLEFPGGAAIVAATTEPQVEAGLARAGFRLTKTEAIKVLKLNALLKPISRFRVTMLDWDAACL